MSYLYSIGVFLIVLFFQLETFLFDASESAYHMIIKKIAELEEKNYAWMDACLADARCVMRS